MAQYKKSVNEDELSVKPVQIDDHSGRYNRRKFILLIAAGVISLILAFVIGYLVRRGAYKPVCQPPRSDILTFASVSEREASHQAMVESLKSENIRENSRFFSSKPHVATFSRNNDLADEVVKRFQSYGFLTDTHAYTVLVSLLPPDKRNYAYVIDAFDGSEIFKSPGVEDILIPEENDTSVIPPFNAYGMNGTAVGEPLYVHYGRPADYEELKKTYGIQNCSGKVVIARHGGLSRASKAFEAENCGAVALLLYNDPADYAPVTDEMYPRGYYAPPDGVERGAVKQERGDPLTPGYAAKDWVYQEEKSAQLWLPSIPVQPVSARDAFAIMKLMGGSEVPANWTDLLNTTYKTGPFADPKLLLKVEVHNERSIKTVTNVVGTVKGEIEPDRYVLIGNHRDSWGFGAADASSGTSVMMEMARVVGEKLKTGWKPWRTIKFCSFDGEEQGGIGATEFTEEFHRELHHRAVAYVNIDTAVTGNDSLSASISSLLTDLFYYATKKVPDIDGSNRRIYDKMVQVKPDRLNPLSPAFGAYPGGDASPFLNGVVMPCVDLRYQAADKRSPSYKVTYFPNYHTLHDTFYFMDKFADPGFRAHLGVARVALTILLRLSDLPVLPFSPVAVAQRLEASLPKVLKALNDSVGSSCVVSTEPLERSVKMLSEAAYKLELKRLATRDLAISNVMGIRMLNDVLMQFERSFAQPGGLPSNPQNLNYIFGAGTYPSFGSMAFPSITDSLYNIATTKNCNAVKKEFTLVTLILESTAKHLT